MKKYLFFILFFPCLFFAQNKTIDSLAFLLSTSKTDSLRAKIHNDLAFEYANLSLFRQAKEHYQKLLEYAQKADYKKGIWSYWSGIATIEFKQGNVNQALENFRILEKKMLAEGADPVSIGVLYNGIANVYDARASYNQAIDYQLKAIEAFRRADNKEYEAIVLGNIASIYYKNGDYKKAIEFHQKSLDIKKEYSSDFSIGTGYFNYAQVYDRMGNTQKTIDLLRTSISYLEKCNDQAGVALCYTSLGLCYVTLYDETQSNGIVLQSELGGEALTKQKLLEKALEFEQKALNIFDSLGENYEINHAYNAMGTVLINQNRNREAINYYLKTYHNCDTTRPELAKTASEGLAEAYKNIGNYKKAYTWQTEFIRLKRKLEQENNQMEMGKQQAELIYQQEKEIEQLKHDKELAKINLQHLQQQNELKQQNETRRKALYSATIIIAVLLLVFYFYKKNTETKNRLLEEAQKAKEAKIKLLEVKNKETALLSTIEGEEKERERIALELHDGVASAITGLRLKFLNKDISKEELDESLKKINNEIRNVSHQLSIPSIKESQNVTVFFENVISNSFSEKEIKVHLTCFPEYDVLGLNQNETINLYRVLQEIFQNINKHAQASEVNISYTRDGDEYTIIVEDNGVGFDKQQIKKGIGLENIEKRLLSLNGNIEIDAVKGRGTCIILNLKKK